MTTLERRQSGAKLPNLPFADSTKLTLNSPEKKQIEEEP